MKRLHVNVAVDDLDRSIAFYGTLFGAEPTVRKDDYAKWMLDDPRVNFAIAAGGRKTGLDHLGIQAESDDELAELAGRLHAAGESVFEQTQAQCCYARSDKAWVTDPSGIAWESFVTHGASTSYGEDTDGAVATAASAPGGSCCAPAPSGEAAAATGRGCCG